MMAAGKRGPTRIDPEQLRTDMGGNVSSEITGGLLSRTRTYVGESRLGPSSSMQKKGYHREVAYSNNSFRNFWQIYGQSTKGVTPQLALSFLAAALALLFV